MKIKSGLMALCVMATLMFAGTASAHAEGPKTEVKQQPEIIDVQAGDSLSSIADAHSTTFVRLFNANDAITNPDILDVGNKVRIPTADETLPDRYNAFVASITPVVSSVAVTSTTTHATATNLAQSPAYARGAVAGNGYAWGNCTWYVKNRRADLPNDLGNGGYWVANAAARGYQTGSVPRAGAVAEQPGHVAYVESVNGDGSVNISEMNYAGGLGQTHTRTVSGGYFRYIY